VDIVDEINLDDFLQLVEELINEQLALNKLKEEIYLYSAMPMLTFSLYQEHSCMNELRQVK